jgi:tol-pal system protein YbgF
MEVFRSGDYESAASLFEAFAEAFAKDDLADNALYWAGECKYTKKKFTEAIKRFKRVVEEYPSGSKVPDALLKIGFAYISLGDKDSAETYLKQVVTRYPFSSAGAKAEERLKTLRQ